MSGHAGNITRGIFVGVVYLAGSLSFSAMAQGAPPDFAPNPSAGWFAYSRQFIPPASGAGPVRPDRAHPGVSNDEFRATGRQPAIAVADLDNPILQPWARAKIRERNELVLSGKQVFSLHASCWPIGVPHFLLEPMTRPMYIVQGPKEVVMILTSFSDVRRIYLADKHADNVKTSWYGDSIGHYEGDTLVVDTIALDDRTFVDGFDTPHTKQLHVVERFHLIDGGETLEANVHVEDPGAFTMPWDAIQRFRRFEAVAAKNVRSLAQLATPEEGPLTEAICAENPNSFMGMPHKPLPQAVVPDF
ncbi:MAG TPA: hypothetical protein VIY51_29065 [Xanthobacteraceae bacterium]